MKHKALARNNKLVPSGRPIKRVMLAVPLTGLVRAEWMLARYGQTIPVNWYNAVLIQWVDTFSPLSYAVDDARNISVHAAVEGNFEWILFIDHDVILPPDTFIKMNNYMAEDDLPVVCGLYRAKGEIGHVLVDPFATDFCLLQVIPYDLLHDRPSLSIVFEVKP